MEKTAHDGSSLFTDAMGPWIQDSGALSLPWTTIIDAETSEYVYSSHAEPAMSFETSLRGVLGL